ncbi:hypothetical protein IP69_09835 [Bosea sp. AAP35]|uniref:hypothetical protein n=1 Tax=Bosea sp. AAP35 TaxID=1523417 RepID=UPI0006B983CC|nr:hypothetical protein [Bosea sp. AAP35]KPF70157.1 hypothetical protein IP69_09835 [Bosea sp. AAP35]
MLQRITLHLGRTASHPEGDSRDGYEITAPLDADGRLVVEEWREARDRCRVRRFRTGAPDQHGWLLHRAGGEGGANWGIDYDDASSDDDEVGYKLDRHRFMIGEYVSIREQDDDFLPYRVVAIHPLGKPVAAVLS